MQSSDILQWRNLRSDSKTGKKAFAFTRPRHGCSNHMLQPGLAKKVTIHLNEDTAAKRDFLNNEIFSFLFARGVAGASLVRPQAGFGAHHRVHYATLGHGVSEHLPVRIEFIESHERVSALMPDLCELLSDGLIEAHDTTVYKSAKRRELPG